MQFFLTFPCFEMGLVAEERGYECRIIELRSGPAPWRSCSAVDSLNLAKRGLRHTHTTRRSKLARATTTFAANTPLKIAVGIRRVSTKRSAMAMV